MNKVILLLCVFIPGYLFGTDILWLKLHPEFSYRDISIACSNISSSPIYLSAEVEEGRVIGAQFHKNPSWPYTARYMFKAKEVDGIRIVSDSAGRWWLEQLSTNVSMLSWILSHVGESYCPPQALLTVYPEVVFDFELDGIEEGILVSHSGKEFFKGEREDGRPYESWIRLTQRRHKEE